MTNSVVGGMNYVEQFYSTNIKLRAFEDALAETMVLIQIFVIIRILLLYLFLLIQESCLLYEYKQSCLSLNAFFQIITESFDSIIIF